MCVPLYCYHGAKGALDGHAEHKTSLFSIVKRAKNSIVLYLHYAHKLHYHLLLLTARLHIDVHTDGVHGDVLRGQILAASDKVGL